MCILPGRSWLSCVPGVICCQVSQMFINAARMSRAQSGDLEFSISNQEMFVGYQVILFLCACV